MKASGSMTSLVQGVSQQVAKDRMPGQHTEYVNTLPDPVRGVTRRHGSRFVAEKLTSLPAAQFAAMVSDTNTYRTYDYTNAMKDYTVVYRTGAKVVGSPLPVVLVYNRTDGVFLDYQRNVTDADLDLLESGGISAIVAVGKYLFMAGNSITPTGTSTNVWADPTNKNYASLWVRGGAYARTFSAKLTLTDNSVVEISYETMTSSYPGVLDTTGVPEFAPDPAGGTTTDTDGAYIADGKYDLHWGEWNPTGLSAKKGTTTLTVVATTTPAVGQVGWPVGSKTAYFHSSYNGATDISLTYTHTKVITNPSYSRTVSDMSNDYNSKVTKWIGDAADDITPENIAAKLQADAIAKGVTGSVLVKGSVVFNNVIAISTDDGGDNTLLRGAAQEIQSVDKLPAVHKIGKIVKVTPSSSSDSFYMKAVSEDPTITSGIGDVRWVEGAGVNSTVTSGLLRGVVNGTNFAVASSAAGLNTLVGGAAPDYVPSRVGDLDTSPMPYFVGKRITYLGVFQDRLCIGAGGVFRASRVGDYLNFFRGSVLTVLADDSLEILSQSAEDDILRFSVLYDKDLVIFADKRQYVVSGRDPLTPTGANMPVMSSHADAALAPPLSVGGVIFYGKVGRNSSSVNQIQPGLNAESPESYLMSSQIDTYLPGTCIELANHSKPTHLFMRTTGERNNLFVYTYLDKEGQGRVQDAWHRWEFGPDLGPIIGMQRTAEGLLVFFLRKVDTQVWLCVDIVPLISDLSKTPYLDSQRPLAQVTAGTGSVKPATPGDLYVAFDDSSEWFLIGDTLANKDDLLATVPGGTNPIVGYGYTSSFTPTNPYVKDSKDKAISTGRTVITSLLLSFAQSSGLTAAVTCRGETTTLEYNARIVGAEVDLVGREVVTDFTQSVPIGHANSEYTVTFAARRWLPFALTGIEWVGQFFNRVRRF